jgi:hypothetical protein
MTQITIDRALVEQALETIEGLTRDRLFTAGSGPAQAEPVNHCLSLTRRPWRSRPSQRGVADCPLPCRPSRRPRT